MFKGLIFMSTASNAVPLYFLALLDDFLAIFELQLGGAMLAYLYWHLCKAWLKKRRQIFGCLLFFRYMCFKLFDY
jgi:hypothetical protein